jgi:hypothetical protein
MFRDQQLTLNTYFEPFVAGSLAEKSAPSVRTSSWSELKSNVTPAFFVRAFLPGGCHEKWHSATSARRSSQTSHSWTQRFDEPHLGESRTRENQLAARTGGTNVSDAPKHLRYAAPERIDKLATWMNETQRPRIAAVGHVTGKRPSYICKLRWSVVVVGGGRCAINWSCESRVRSSKSLLETSAASVVQW